MQTTHMATPVLEVAHLEKVYGALGNVTRALNDVSFTVNRGEFVGIMGASGSGKSTLLNCVSTIDSATAQDHCRCIQAYGGHCEKERRDCAFAGAGRRL